MLRQRREETHLEDKHVGRGPRMDVVDLQAFRVGNVDDVRHFLVSHVEGEGCRRPRASRLRQRPQTQVDLEGGRAYDSL